MKKAVDTRISINPFHDATTLGGVLMRMKKITKEQLHQAIGVQARTNEHLLGALLIEQGCVTQLDVAKALEIQHNLRSGDRADAELCLLEATLDETAEAQADLNRAIERRRAVVRSRGEDTGAFLAYPRRATV